MLPLSTFDVFIVYSRNRQVATCRRIDVSKSTNVHLLYVIGTARVVFSWEIKWCFQIFFCDIGTRLTCSYFSSFAPACAHKLLRQIRVRFCLLSLAVDANNGSQSHGKRAGNKCKSSGSTTLTTDRNKMLRTRKIFDAEDEPLQSGRADKFLREVL